MTGGPRPQAPPCCHAHHDRAGCASSTRSSCPGSAAAGAGHPPPARPRPRAGVGGVGPHRRPGSAADHRPTTAEGRWPPEASLLATARHPVLRARTPAVLHGPAAGAAALALTASGPARRPGNLALLGRTPDHRGRHFRARRGAGPGKTFLPGRIRHGPSMYEMEGPCPASPRQAGQLAGFADAARRPPGPDTRASGRSPGSSRVPGVAPGWCPFPAVKVFLLPPRAPRKALRPAISCFFAIHEGIHRKQAVIRISQRLSTDLLTACPQATGCKPENT